MKNIDYEYCIKDAKKYTTIENWQKGSRIAFKTAKLRGWLTKCTLHMEAIFNRKWNENACKNEALKYKSINEWAASPGSSYQTAVRFRWVEKFTSHMDKRVYVPTKWTLQACIIEGKKHKTIADWRSKSSGSYLKARNESWLIQCGHVPLEPYWSKEKCIAIASKFVTELAWSRNSKISYRYATEKNWLAECLSHLKPKSYTFEWTLDKCIVEAEKYLTTKEWRESDITSYSAAIRSGWKDLCTKGMIDISKWNAMACKMEAEKYKTLDEFKKDNRYVYNKMKSRGWLSLCCKHMVGRTKSKKRPTSEWCLYRCAVDALNYNSASEWRVNNYDVFIIAFEHGWLECMDFSLLLDIKHERCK